MITQWGHIPNAAHIDRVLASAKANPDQWAVAWTSVWKEHDKGPVTQNTELVAAWSTVWDTAYTQGRHAVWSSASSATNEGVYWDPTRVSARNAAQSAILVLVAYDDCAYMLDSDPGELAILAAFGDPRASLVLAACRAFHSLKTNA